MRVERILNRRMESIKERADTAKNKLYAWGLRELFKEFCFEDATLRDVS